MLTTVACAAGVGAAVAVVRDRRRLRESMEAVDKEASALGLERLEAVAAHKAVAEMHEALRGTTCEASLSRLAALEARCAATERIADRWVSMCGRVPAWARGKSIARGCEAIEARSKHLMETARGVDRVRSFVADEQVALTALEIDAEARESLPPRAPWRAPWQSRERADDVARVVAFARRRSEPGAIAPLDTYANILATLRAKADAGHGARLVEIRASCDAVADALASSSELYEERRQLANLREATRAADAAVRTETETRKLRLAQQDLAKESRRCARAVDKLAAALDTYEDHSPRSFADCRNTQDPVSLEPLRNLPLGHISRLPSGNCIATKHLLQLHRNVDPCTNLDLPPDFRSNIKAAPSRAALADFLRRAEQACPRPPAGSDPR